MRLTVIGMYFCFIMCGLLMGGFIGVMAGLLISWGVHAVYRVRIANQARQLHDNTQEKISN